MDRAGDRTMTTASGRWMFKGIAGVARRTWCGITAALLALHVALAVSPAAAHPHVWIVARAQVIVENGQIVAIRHRWAFDEGYTKMAIEGLDQNGDGVYDRNELAELAQVNVEGLKEFDYFTRARAGTKTVANGVPKDFHLEYTAQGELSLYYTLTLAEPIALKGGDVFVEISDPTIFIDFRFDKTDAVTMTGAPAGCTAVLEAQTSAAEQVSKLGQAFAAEMQGMVNANLPQQIRIACAG
jgi:ABC-type uncharacterized transport system substrate-binding protein